MYYVGFSGLFLESGLFGLGYILVAWSGLTSAAGLTPTVPEMF